MKRCKYVRSGVYVNLNMHYRCKGMRKRRTECGHMDVFRAVVCENMPHRPAKTAHMYTCVYTCGFLSVHT